MTEGSPIPIRAVARKSVHSSNVNLKNEVLPPRLLVRLALQKENIPHPRVDIKAKGY